MAVSVHVPRINNNDDEVKLVELLVAVGDRVAAGQRVAAVETDKAVMDVESGADGFVLATQGALGSMVKVGQVLIWLGASADEVAPMAASASTAPAGHANTTAAPTAKARALLAAYGLAENAVSAAGSRLTAAEVEQHVQRLGLRPLAEAGAAGLVSSAESATPEPKSRKSPSPSVAGHLKPLRSDQRGMLATVSWQRDFAVPGYIELPFDQAPWDARAANLQQQHGLLLNPLLPLMAWRLATLLADKPQLNATIVDDQRFEYSMVNLGFTVQAGEVLYLAVTRNAAAMTELAFVQHLVDVQRRAAAHKLSPDETQGATAGFSSMARWKVGRHIPVLAPLTAVMVAHTQGPDGQSVLGATYDHRVVHGADIASLLRKLSQPKAPT